MSGALDGVRVLDVATLYPAPLLAAMLGDLGADVVKVEPPEGDPLRAMGAAPFAIVGRNKRSVCLALDAPDGLALLQRFTAVTDVVIFNQPVRVLERWSCTDEELASRNERAVVVHVSTFGSSGPYAERVGNGSLAEAFVGLDAGRVPTGDTLGALSGVIGVLSALYERDTSTGRGRVVDVSLYEAVLPLLAPALAGSTAPRSVRDTIRASDGRAVMIAATTESQIERLRAVTDGDVAAWISGTTSADAVAVLVDARIPAVAVNDVAQLRVDPHVVARGSIPGPGRTPAVGEHTAEVVEEWLGGARA